MRYINPRLTLTLTLTHVKRLEQVVAAADKPA